MLEHLYSHWFLWGVPLMFLICVLVAITPRSGSLH